MKFEFTTLMVANTTLCDLYVYVYDFIGFWTTLMYLFANVDLAIMIITKVFYYPVPVGGILLYLAFVLGKQKFISSVNF